MFRTIILGLLLIAIVNRHSDGAFIINGSFETPLVLSVENFKSFTAGQNIDGWTVVGTDVLLVANARSEPTNGINTFNSQDGHQNIDLSGIGNTGLLNGVQHLITTATGITYRLSFFVGRADGNNLYSTASTVDLSIDGGPRMSFTNSNSTEGAVNWKYFEHTFTATSGSTLITFFNGTDSPFQFGGPNNYVGIDNIQLSNVSAVPEPVTFAIWGIGMLGLAAFGRRKRIA